MQKEKGQRFPSLVLGMGYVGHRLFCNFTIPRKYMEWCLFKMSYTGELGTNIIQIFCKSVIESRHH